MTILTQSKQIEHADYSSDLLPLTTSGIITQAWFASIVHWSDANCIDLLQYYWENERKYRKGWNNNMSLVTQEGKAGDITWSLIYWKFENFKQGVGVITPFKLEPDERGILRATTDFHNIISNAIFWSQKDEAVITGGLREALIEGLYWRLRYGFGWTNKKSAKKNNIRRYRLVALLNSPNLVLNSDFDAHHLNGVKALLGRNKAFAATDDRSLNIKIQHKSEHRHNHYHSGDSKFKDYRKSKQLRLDI